MIRNLRISILFLLVCLSTSSVLAIAQSSYATRSSHIGRATALDPIEYQTAVATAASTADNGTWSAFGGIGDGCNGAVTAATTAANGDLYVSGIFSVCGNAAAAYIARWNANAWSALGSGTNGVIYAIAVSGNDVYVGGNFSEAGGVAAKNVAHWDGNSWSALGQGVYSPLNPYAGVSAIAISGTDVYVGGGFDSAGAASANNIARWDSVAQTWSALGSGTNGVAGSINALAILNGQVYAGGSFNAAGGSTASNIAAWNGTTWSGLGTGVNSAVNALAVSGNTLYAGGTFTTAGGQAANRVASWNGASWSALGSGSANGTDRGVLALSATPAGLYVGGQLTKAGGVTEGYLALWNGSTWSSVGGGLSSLQSSHVVRALAATNSKVYVGGAFNYAGAVAAHFIAAWDGAAWSALQAPAGNGLAAGVQAAASYAGRACFGTFWPARTGQGQLLCWNGSSWAPLGGTPLVASSLDALLSLGTDLYIGGSLGYAGNGCCILDWNGSALNAIGSGSAAGTDDEVFAIAASGSNLYVGGFFYNAGGQPAKYVAMWDGAAWHPLGSGTDSLVRALAVYGGKLYAGGDFSQAGGVSAPSLAVWDGAAWSAVGAGGFDGQVNALLVVGPDLYVGGSFTHAGGIAANGIARWDGATWNAITTTAGNGVLARGGAGQVTALANAGTALFIGGLFDDAGGVAANNVARWDGVAFTTLGSGSSNGVELGYVAALTVNGADIYVGGTFGLAGGQLSSSVARYKPDQIFSNGGFE